MRKVALFLALTSMVVGVAIADEVVPYPFWQHGWGCTTFFSVTNNDDIATGTDATVTVNLLDKVDGSVVAATTSTVSPQTAWMPDTGNWDPDMWWQTQSTTPDKTYLGFGTFDMTSDAAKIYLWACIYGSLSPVGQAGYTIVMPGNPYGA